MFTKIYKAAHSKKWFENQIHIKKISEGSRDIKLHFLNILKKKTYLFPYYYYYLFIHQINVARWA